MSSPGKLETRLRARRDAGQKLLLPYLSAGITDQWIQILLAMAAAGADAIEVGMPFSDPVMDGTTIQEASLQALQRGTNPGSVLSELTEIAAEVDVPLTVMTYANIAFRSGARRFASELTAAGVSGAIIPDIPLEELSEWEPAANAAGVETVMLASPIATDERLAAVCARSKGFVYGVNVLGVTGERVSLGDQVGAFASRLKAATDLPVVMGFGVSTPAQAAEVVANADGVIVGSALMRTILDGGGPEAVGESVAALRASIDNL